MGEGEGRAYGLVGEVKGNGRVGFRVQGRAEKGFLAGSGESCREGFFEEVLRRGAS